ncbi:hypothetical protein BHM03_00038481 [Ensete ventricosum]|nr:hypothetical protein BHM03_00038481 [Ensete ventricosum]
MGIAIVRLKKHGVRFEIACYYNKVLSGRSRVADDSTGAKFENPIRSDYHAPQDLVSVKDANLEQMPMNLKEGDCYVVNHGEGLTTVDFGGHGSLAEKEGAGMVERRSGTEHAQQKGWSISCRWTIVEN